MNLHFKIVLSKVNKSNSYGQNLKHSLFRYRAENSGKMFKFILLVTLFALAAANDDDVNAEVKSAYNHGDGFGHFQYGYDLTNGVEAKASGDVNAIHGEYFYLNEKGEKVKVTYTADSTGFHPESSILPGSA